ncbi:hypothetical protein BS50DRAFT_628727 [Corynespora cassiicola Philippines]|uniref:Uncharacterized protein n=1 Tax=Corynespora cassiicola Philippines TaxID=1448308 RepID=A0A2T2PD19_CORCC|nr:hypothetical protein BS50DRAFT_628727 [Corynespora cassiicola Philippines]
MPNGSPHRFCAVHSNAEANVKDYFYCPTDRLFYVGPQPLVHDGNPTCTALYKFLTNLWELGYLDHTGVGPLFLQPAYKANLGFKEGYTLDLEAKVGDFPARIPYRTSFLIRKTSRSVFTYVTYFVGKDWKGGYQEAQSGVGEVNMTTEDAGGNLTA